MTTDAQSMKSMVDSYIDNLPAGIYFRPRKVVADLNLAQSKVGLVGAWCTQHPRCEKWSRTHYTITEDRP